MKNVINFWALALATVTLPFSAAAQQYQWTNFAGLPGGLGTADGAANVARFDFPGALAVDASGNVYVADSSNYKLRKVAPSGSVTTIAGFYHPDGVAVDIRGTTGGNIYVAETQTHVIYKVTPAGVVTLLAGSSGQSGNADGIGGAARFYSPWGLAVDADGNVFVGDSDNCTIRKVTPSGTVTTLAGSAGLFGGADGTGSAARFWLPKGVALDASGNLYVGDSGNATIRKVTPAGVVTTFAGSAGLRGTTDGSGSSARFSYPDGVALDAGGYVYVADYSNHTIRKITPAGLVTTLAGSAGFPGLRTGLETPRGSTFLKG